MAMAIPLFCESSSMVSPGCLLEGVAGDFPARCCAFSSRELGLVLATGIWILAPQKGHIPFRPAWNYLTFSLCPFGQKKRIPIIGYYNATGPTWKPNRGDPPHRLGKLVWSQSGISGKLPHV
jgi:hypothetical protein